MPLSDCKIGDWYVVFTCGSCGTRQPLYSDPSKGKAKIDSAIARCAYCGRSRFYRMAQLERYKHSPSGDLGEIGSRLDVAPENTQQK